MSIYETAKELVFWGVVGFCLTVVFFKLTDKVLTLLTKSFRVYRTILEFYCYRKSYYAWLEETKRVKS
jgi:hypothetical protein